MSAGSMRLVVLLLACLALAAPAAAQDTEPTNLVVVHQEEDGWCSGSWISNAVHLNGPPFVSVRVDWDCA